MQVYIKDQESQYRLLIESNCGSSEAILVILRVRNPNIAWNQIAEEVVEVYLKGQEFQYRLESNRRRICTSYLEVYLKGQESQYRLVESGWP